MAEGFTVPTEVGLDAVVGVAVTVAVAVGTGVEILIGKEPFLTKAAKIRAIIRAIRIRGISWIIPLI